MSVVRSCLALIVMSILFGCVSVKVENKSPDGFAEYRGAEDYLAISPDRVVYRVRDFDNVPRAEISFWSLALKTHMLDSGYRLLSETEISSKTRTGKLLELTAPVGNADYRYILALFVTQKKIFLVESSGEVQLFNAHREAINEAIKELVIE